MFSVNIVQSVEVLFRHNLFLKKDSFKSLLEGCLNDLLQRVEETTFFVKTEFSSNKKI